MAKNLILREWEISGNRLLLKRILNWVYWRFENLISLVFTIVLELIFINFDLCFLNFWNFWNGTFFLDFILCLAQSLSLSFHENFKIILLSSFYFLQRLLFLIIKRTWNNLCFHLICRQIWMNPFLFLSFKNYLRVKFGSTVLSQSFV